MASGLIISWQIGGETMETVRDFIFLDSKITADGDCSHEMKRCLLLGRKAMTNLDGILKSRDITDKGLYSQSYAFSSGHVWMWELNYKESWVPKNWCFQTVVLEKTLESPLACKKIKPVNPKGNQSWIFIGRTNAEVPIPWPSDIKNWLIWKDPDAGKDWRQEKGMIEGEMVGWHHRLNGHEFEQALGGGDPTGQGTLTSCSMWDCKDRIWLSDWTQLNRCCAPIEYTVITWTEQSTGGSTVITTGLCCCCFFFLIIVTSFWKTKRVLIPLRLYFCQQRNVGKKAEWWDFHFSPYLQREMGPLPFGHPNILDFPLLFLLSSLSFHLHTNDLQS